eukprot:UN26825
MDENHTKLKEKITEFQKLKSAYDSIKDILSVQSAEVETQKQKVRELEVEGERLDRMKQVEEQEVVKVQRSIQKEGSRLVGSYTKELLDEPEYDHSFLCRIRNPK